jgi:DNA polymerase-3 subunit beta
MEEMMKLKIVKEDLQEVLNHAINFTSSKNLNSILQNILIEAEENALTIRASNIHTAFTSKIDATVESTGITTVPCKKLLDIVKELPQSAVVDFSFDGHKLKIKSGKASFNLSTLSPELFPTIGEITPEYFIEIPGKNLQSILKKVYFCISNDTSKIEYSGCHFKAYGNKLEVSAADYQRIAMAFTEFDEEFSDEFLINIPKKTVIELIKILEKDELVKIETDRKQIVFKVGNIEIYSKLIEKYIKSITTLFNTEYPVSAKLPKNEFIEVLKRVSSITSEITHGVVLSFNNGKVSIYSLETEYGLGHDYIENIDYKGEDLDIIFNSKQLIEILSSIESDFVELKMNGRKSPAIIIPQDNWYKYLIVPLTIEQF